MIQAKKKKNLAVKERAETFRGDFVLLQRPSCKGDGGGGGKLKWGKTSTKLSTYLISSLKEG